MGRVVFVLCGGSMATARRPQSKRICIVSLQHFGGRRWDHGLGAGCAGTRRTGPHGRCRGSSGDLAAAPHPDLGRPWVLRDFGSEANCVSRATGPVPPVPVAPSPAPWGHRFGPAVRTDGRSGPGRHQQPPSWFSHAWAAWAPTAFPS